MFEKSEDYRQKGINHKVIQKKKLNEKFIKRKLHSQPEYLLNIQPNRIESRFKKPILNTYFFN